MFQVSPHGTKPTFIETYGSISWLFVTVTKDSYTHLDKNSETSLPNEGIWKTVFSPFEK